MINSNTSLILRLLVLKCIFLMSQIAIAQPLFTAFTYLNDASVILSSNEKNTSKSNIQNWTIITSNQLSLLGIGQQFSVPLPTGEKIIAEVTSVIKHPNQDIQLISKVNGGGRIVLTIGSSAVYGSINSGANSYSITTIDQQTTLVSNRALPNFAGLNNDVITPSNTLDFRTPKFKRELKALSNRSENSSSKTNVDILFVYSAEFTEMFNSPETRIK